VKNKKKAARESGWRVVGYPVGQPAAVVALTWKEVRSFVGGAVQAIPIGAPGKRFGEGLYLLCNEDGWGLGLPANRWVGELQQWIAGPFLIVQQLGDDYASMTDAQVASELQNQRPMATPDVVERMANAEEECSWTEVDGVPTLVVRLVPADTH
jgi:hypothetical protein